jgi:hypothetical protein
MKLRDTSTFERVDSVLRFGRISTSLKSSLTSVSIRIGAPCTGGSRQRAPKGAIPPAGGALRSYRSE